MNVGTNKDMQNNQRPDRNEHNPIVMDDVQRRLQLETDNRRVLKLYGASKTLLVIIIILVIGAAAGKLIWGWTHGGVATETKKYYDEYRGDDAEASNQKANKPTTDGTASDTNKSAPKSPQNVRQEIIEEATKAR